MDKKVIKIVQDYLDATDRHIAAHEHGPDSYCYINDNGYDYSDHLSGPESVETAFAEGWFWVDSMGIRCCCQHQIPVLPLEFDFPKIRRRIEDRLRKLQDKNILLRLASELDIELI